MKSKAVAAGGGPASPSCRRQVQEYACWLSVLVDRAGLSHSKERNPLAVNTLDLALLAKPYPINLLLHL